MSTELSAGVTTHVNMNLRLRSSVNRHKHTTKTHDKYARRKRTTTHYDDSTILRLMDDDSIFYDLFLSGSFTRSQVNTELKKRDSYFVGLTDRQYNFILEQWLFQMLSNGFE